MNSRIVLSKRLNTAVLCCLGASSVADIGTDHGLAGAYLLLYCGVEKAVLSDIAPGPLERALKTVERCGLSDRVELRLSDGFSAIEPWEFDTALICGMGGLCIISILASSRPGMLEGKRLVLQPQSDAMNLRAFLFDSGWRITEERAVVERGHAYTVISCTGGIQSGKSVESYAAFCDCWADHREIWLGGLQPSKPDDAAFLRAFLRLQAARLRGAELSGKNSDGLRSLVKNIQSLSEVMEWQQ